MPRGGTRFPFFLIGTILQKIYGFVKPLFPG